MGVVKVETLDVTVSSNGQTQAITNVGNVNSAFIRNTNTRNMSGGPTASTSNEGPDALSVYPAITSTTQVTFTRPNAITQRYMAEVWRYTGASSGPDEFIRRGTFTVSLGANVENNSVSVSGIVNRNKCICFITGKHTTTTSNTVWQEAMAIAYIDASNNLVVSRQDTNGGALDVQVDVVEFTGSNWSVGYYRGSFVTGQKTLLDDSRGNVGSTFDVVNWSSAMIVDAQMEGDSGGNNAIEDRSYVAKAGTSTTSVEVTKDSTSANDGDIFIYVLVNGSMIVGRNSTSKSIPNNGTIDTTLPFPTGVTISDLTEAALEFTAFSDGGGTAHARGALSAYLSGVSQITTWVHRSGNTGSYQYGAADLSGINGVANLIVSDIDTDEVVGNSQAGVVVTGSAFEATQGTGTVILAENSDGSGTTVTQTVNTWSDTSINIDIVSGGLADTNCFLIVTSDSGSSGFLGVQVGSPPITYEEVIDGFNPDHYWTFNNTYLDSGVIGGSTATVNFGSPGFTTNPLCRDTTHAFTISAQGQRIEAPDNNEMNLQTETTRTMSGWIRITEVQDSFVCFYEEGGGVNNLAFFMGNGGILIAQLADTGDDNVHAYSDFKLQPNRNYYITFRFNYSGTDLFELLIDGVLQSSTFGNPLGATDLDAHSGDIGWGDAEGTLEVFGTDITFPAAVTSYYNHWASWTVFLSEAQVREMFEKGVIGDHTISSATQAAMQTALDAFADTVQPNTDCSFIIKPCTDGNFTLEFDNITFDDSTSIHIQYQGTDILTVKNLNGSNIEASKVSTPNFGTVNIITPATITITGLVAGSEVRVFEAGTTTEIGGVESSGTSFALSVEVASIDISVLSLGYQNFKLKGEVSTSDRTIPVAQEVDRQFLNP